MKKLIKVIISLAVFLAMIIIPQQQFVHAGAEDTEAPVVLSISIDKHEVVPGDTVTVTCEVTDESEISEGSTGFYSRFRNGNLYSNYIYFTKQENGVYTASLKIPETYVNGKYTISTFYVQDALGNTYSFYSQPPADFQDIYFEVSGSSDDNEAPVVLSISIDKHEVVPGDTVTVTCEVTDESEISEGSTGFYSRFRNGNLYSNYIYFTKQENGVYTASLKIPETYVNGKYTISSFYIQDVLGNAYSFYSQPPVDFQDIYFEVNEASDDREAPIITNLFVDKYEVAPGDTLTVTCEVTDESEMATGATTFYLQFKNGVNTSNYLYFKKQSEGVYTATLTITDQYKVGKYSLSWFTIQDVVGNSYTLSNPTELPEAFANSSFRVLCYSEEHEYESEIISPTCIEQGYTAHTCIKCGTSYKDTFTDPLGGEHVWDAGVVTREPTLLNPGVKTYTCSICGGHKYDVIPAGENHEVLVAHSVGTTLYSTSSAAIYSVTSEDESIATGVITSWNTTWMSGGTYYGRTITIYGKKEGSTRLKILNSNGVVTGYLNVKVTCGSLDIQGHTGHVENIVLQSPLDDVLSLDKQDIIFEYEKTLKTNSISINNQTYTNSYYEYTISLLFEKIGEYDFTLTGMNSGDIYVGHAEIENHTWDIETVVEEPTCIRGGLKTYRCSQCGLERSETLDLNPNNHSSNTRTVNIIEPTCLEEGYTGDTYCMDCGELISEGAVVPVREHSLYYNQAEPNSCTTYGYIEYWTCYECGKLFADEEGKQELEYGDLLIEPTGHDLIHNEGFDAGFETTGIKEHWECSYCGKSYSDKYGWNEMTDNSWIIPSIKSQTGTTPGWHMANEKWYYIANNVLYKGWLKSGNDWYYLDAQTGAMRTDFVDIGGYTYFFNPDGRMVTGLLFYPDGPFYFDTSGHLMKGWIRDNSGSDDYWMYGDPKTGQLQRGLITVGNKKYYMDPYWGNVQYGWINLDGNWYYAGSSGALATGWVKVGSTWYYMDNDGVMQTGWVTVGGSKYYMASSGAMLTGWVKDGGTWYYMSSSGAMAIGWVKDGNTWYYMKADGSMAASEWVTGYYWISARGAWTYQPVGSWKKNDTGWWFGDTSGWYAKNETLKINDIFYTFNAAGYWVE